MPAPLIYNPIAGRGRGEALARGALEALRSRGVDAELVPTSGPMEAALIAERRSRAGDALILALGGDGTHSEVADGVLRSGRQPAIGLLPAGTGNDFLMDFGLTTLDAAAARIARGEPRAVDAGLARWDGGERHFLGVFGIGFMAKVCDYANRRLKWMGPAGYTWGVFPELARLRAPATRLALDGKEHDGEYALVAVCNARHMGGGMKVAPDADVSDGLLDVVALRRVGRARLLRIFPKIFDGSHVGLPQVLVERAHEVRIEPSEPSPLLGDGEVYGATPVSVRALPAALRLLV